MNCPYCSNEMELGELSSSHAIWWNKGQGSEDTPNNISLTKTTVKGFLKAMSEGCSIEAHHCPHCKKIILSHE